jgi:RNA polymerase sigma-70 factor, ECF subfamily
VLPHRETLMRFALHLTRDASDAQDLVQDTLLRAYTRFHQLRTEDATLAWLRCILRSIFLHKVNRKKRDLTGFEAVADHEASRPIAGTEQSALNAVEVETVERAVMSLSPIYRDILLMTMAELSYNEIVERSGLPMATVKARIHRARKMVQKALTIN